MTHVRSGASKRLVVALVLAIATGLIVAGFVVWPGSPPPPPALEPIALVGVTVVDVSTGALQPNVTVLIEDRRIRAIAPTSTTQLPTGVQVVDARGKFLVPGFWDMHTHSVLNPGWRALYPLLLLAKGVTGARSMDTELPIAEAGKRAEPRSDIDALEPRVVRSGRMVNGPGGQSKTSVVLRTPTESASVLDALARDGSDFVKVYNGVPREAYFALLAEARRRGVPVVGHVPWAVSAEEAADSGQLGIEHLTGMLVGCSRGSAELTRVLVRARSDTSRPLPVVERKVGVDAAGSFSPERCVALAQRMAANKTWHTPTLVNLRMRALDSLAAGAMMTDGRFAAAELGERGAREQISVLMSRPPRERTQNQLVWQRQKEVATLLHAAGVQFLAGTDLPAALAVPGVSLHDELALLVSTAGLSTLEALQAATINPARFLGTTDSLGTVAPGKLADLVLLEGNPLERIDNTRRIAGVLVSGRYLDEMHLRTLVERAQKIARWRRWTKFTRS